MTVSQMLDLVRRVIFESDRREEHCNRLVEESADTLAEAMEMAALIEAQKHSFAPAEPVELAPRTRQPLNFKDTLLESMAAVCGDERDKRLLGPVLYAVALDLRVSSVEALFEKCKWARLLLGRNNANTVAFLSEMCMSECCVN